MVKEQIDEIKSLVFRQKQNLPEPCFQSTIRNMDGCMGVVKLEIVIKNGNAIVTQLSGDIITVLGCYKSDLIGEDLFKYFDFDPAITQKAWSDLHKYNYAKKRNTIIGKDGFRRELEGRLFWREKGKSIVEIIELV